MLNIQLYIEGQEVDLFKDESITLTQSLQDVKDINKVFTDFSRTFSVPASKTNNKIFGHFYNYHIVGEQAFDARKKKTAQLFLNYELFKDGKVKFEGATRKDNKAHTYKLTFFGNGVNLKDLLGEDKLSALPLLRESFFFTYNSANIKTLLKDGLDVTVDEITYTDAVIFPLITHTKRLVYDSGFATANDNTATQNNIAYEASTTDTGLELTQLKPALRVYPIIKAIESKYNITFSEDFFSVGNEPFHSLYLWLHNKTGGLFEDEGNETPIENFVLDDENTNGNPIELLKNTFTTPTNRKPKKERLLDVTIEPSISSAFTFIIYRDGLVYEEYKDVTRDATTNTFLIRDLVLDAGTYSFAIDTGTASTYNINFDVRYETFGGRRKTHFTATADVLSDAQLRVSNQLPDIKVIDFLTNLFKMFNLTSFQTDDGIISVKTLDNFYASSTKIWDLTEFIDKTQSMVDTVLPFKQVDFSYDGLDNFFAANHLELFKKKWGAENYTAEDLDKIEGQTYKVTVGFEHFKYERLKDINDGSFKDLVWGWSVDIKQQSSLGKPLLFYPILSTQDIGVLNTDGSKSLQSDVYLPSNSLEHTDSRNINFSSEPNEYAGTPFRKTLFVEYYKNYIKEIFDAQRRLTTVKGYLPLSVSIEIDLADKVRIFENLYKINKITTNFETNLSTLELINIKPDGVGVIEVPVLIPDKFQPNANAITADTTSIFADSSLIKADADGNFDGVEVIAPLEEIPRELDTGNIPLIDNSSNPLPVTKASITVNTPTVITNNTIIFNATINELGTLGGVKQLDEYGFFYSTDQSAMLSENIDVLKSIGTVNQIKFETTELNKRINPNIVQTAATSLSESQTIFYRFYVFTNTDPQHTITSVISELKSATTKSTF